MIQRGRATFAVSSTDTPVDEISSLLGVQPTSTTPKGWISRSGRVREHGVWLLETPEIENTVDDETGTRALRELLRRCRPFAERLSSLPPDCVARIWWSGDSDSVQGGFVLPADLATEISALGVDVYATVYLAEESTSTE